jgi:hypothetical protein
MPERKAADSWHMQLRVHGGYRHATPFGRLLRRLLSRYSSSNSQRIEILMNGWRWLRLHCG